MATIGEALEGLRIYLEGLMGKSESALEFGHLSCSSASSMKVHKTSVDLRIGLLDPI